MMEKLLKLIIIFHLTVGLHSTSARRANFTFVSDDNVSVTVIYDEDPEFHIQSWEELRENIGFYLYTARSNPSLPPKRLYLNDANNLRNSGFNPKIPTKILIHGLGNTLKSDMIQTIKNTYLESDFYNVIGVEWCQYSGGCNAWVPIIYYSGARSNTIFVGNYVAKFLAFLTRVSQVRSEDLHVIGYSLGAHVAGIAGRTIVVDELQYLGRITGLDPAGFWYPKKDDPEDYNQLQAKDASFVDVIHTDNYYGQDYNVGHVDFFVYGGHNQPACSWYQAACSHSMSYQYFEKAIRGGESFLAFECASLDDARSAKGPNCLKSATLFMGEKLSNESQGIYFVQSPGTDCVTSNVRDSALANNRGPSLFATVCNIIISNLHKQHPLLMKPKGNSNGVGLYLPHEKAGLFSLNYKDKIRLACPGENNNLVLRNGQSFKELDATCNGGNTFSINGCNYDITKLPCFEIPVYTQRRAQFDKTCDNNKGFMIEVGFEVGTDFLRNMDICFDGHRKIAFWSRYQLQPGIRDESFVIDARTRKTEWKQGEFYPKMEVDKLYVKQLEVVTRILGSKTRAQDFIRDKVNYFLSRGHLSANADFIYGSQKLATYLFVNAAPQWQIFNSNNWAKLEEDVRSFAGSNNLQLTVYTGTLGVMTLPNRNLEQKEIWLSLEPKSLPAPRLFWKVVYNEHSPEKEAIAFIGTNNPFVTQNEASQHICTDICDQITMPLTWDRKNLELGYSYCCAVDDEFKKAVKTLPDNLEVKGVLTLRRSLKATSTIDCAEPPVYIDADWRDMRPSCIAPMRQQVQIYLEAALNYLAMGAFFARESVNRPGFTNLFMERATEMREQAIQVLKYLLMRGDLTADLRNVVRNRRFINRKSEWNSGMEALQDSLRLEVQVTREIRRIIENCEYSEDFDDFHVVKYLTASFLAAQHQAQRELAGKISVLAKLVDKHGHGVLSELLFDKKLLSGDAIE